MIACFHEHIALQSTFFQTLRADFLFSPQTITSLSSSDSGSDSAVKKKRLIDSATPLQALKQGQ